VTERRIPVLRVLLVWLLLELVAAAQVRRADGHSTLWVWLETGARPWLAAGQRLADLGGLLADGVTNTRRLIESHLAMRLELEQAEAYNLLLREELWASREAAQLAPVGIDFHSRCLVTRCAFRNLVLGRMQVTAGSADAVRYDTAAVVIGGLAGRVVRLGQHSSWLELITHPASAVAVRTEDGLVRGLVSGSGGELLTVQFVPRSGALIRGDLLVTSSADGIYPPGIPVATVTSVRESDAAFLEVTARPTADLATARVVLLLPEWAPTTPPEWQP
jgi:cell shape-determining protein MreC